jgi:hypothetical protein
LIPTALTPASIITSVVVVHVEQTDSASSASRESASGASPSMVSAFTRTVERTAPLSPNTSSNRGVDAREQVGIVGEERLEVVDLDGRGDRDRATRRSRVDPERASGERLRCLERT